MNSWINPNRIVTAEPLPKDLALLTFIDGRFAGLHSPAQHERVTAYARQIAEKSGRPVKVLPVTLPETLNFLGSSLEEFVSSAFEGEQELRAWVVQSLKAVVRDENDRTVRQEAYDMLVGMGEIEP